MDDKMVESKSITIAPADYKDWSYPERVLVFGSLDLGISKDPRSYHNVAGTQIASEVGWKLDQQLISSKIEDGLVWRDLNGFEQKKTPTQKSRSIFQIRNFEFLILFLKLQLSFHHRGYRRYHSFYCLQL
jgi:hypothetical protein